MGIGALVNGTALASIVSFIILAVFLARVAWQPLRKLMADRQERISKALSDAAQAREEAEKLRAQLEADRARARSEAQAIMARSEETAKARAAEILAQAKETAERSRKAALSEIEAEREQAIRSIRTEVAELSLRIAERVLGEELRGERQKQVLERAIADVVRVQ
jgi:F-type H+-transporting ATPase subunit b